MISNQSVNFLHVTSDPIVSSISMSFTNSKKKKLDLPVDAAEIARVVYDSHVSGEDSDDSDSEIDETIEIDNAVQDSQNEVLNQTFDPMNIQNNDFMIMLNCEENLKVEIEENSDFYNDQ